MVVGKEVLRAEPSSSTSSVFCCRPRERSFVFFFFFAFSRSLLSLSVLLSPSAAAAFLLPLRFSFTHSFSGAGARIRDLEESLRGRCGGFLRRRKNGNFCFLSFLLFFSVLLSFGLTSLSGKQSCVSRHFFSLAFELTYSFSLIL